MKQLTFPSIDPSHPRPLVHRSMWTVSALLTDMFYLNELTPSPSDTRATFWAHLAYARTNQPLEYEQAVEMHRHEYPISE